MGIRYQKNILSTLGLKDTFQDEDFEFENFKSTLLDNSFEPELFEYLIELLSDLDQKVKSMALKSIELYLKNDNSMSNDEIELLLKDLAINYEIDL